MSKRNNNPLCTPSALTIANEAYIASFSYTFSSSVQTRISLAVGTLPIPTLHNFCLSPPSQEERMFIILLTSKIILPAISPLTPSSPARHDVVAHRGKDEFLCAKSAQSFVSCHVYDRTGVV